MRKEKKLIYTVILLMLIVLGTVIRAEGSDELGNVSRQIIISGDNKYKTFLLDESIYKQAKQDLSDLRIVSSKGIRIPYYINHGNNKNMGLHSTKSAVFTVRNQEKQTDIQINNGECLKIKELILEAEGVFKRRYKVTGIDSEGQSFFLKSGELYNLDFKEASAKHRTIYFNEYVQYPILSIDIYNEDDQPLVIADVKMDYWTDQVVFAAESQETYMLWYGNREALKPSYDIEKYRTYVEKEPKDISTLAEPIVQEISTQRIKTPINMQVVFNILIVITAVVLIVVVLKKLKNT